MGQLYPPYLVLLILGPILVGYFTNADLLDRFSLPVNLIWLPVFTIFYSVTQSKVIYNTIAVFYFLLGFVEITHWIILKGPLTITSLLTIFNTNYEEVIGFYNLKASYHLFLLVPYLALFFLALKHPPKNRRSKLKPFLIGFYIVGFLAFIYLANKRELLLLKGVPQIARVSHSFIYELNKYNSALKNAKVREIENTYTSYEDEQIFLFILGESLNRNHMSLYGYQKPTSVKLEKRNDMVIFDNVVAAYSNTLDATLSMLTEANLENELPFSSSVDLLDIFHSAGFKTYWISNHSPLGIWGENILSALGKKSDQSEFVNIFSNSSDEADTKRSYDIELIEPLKRALHEKEPKKFIVLQLMGSHSTYKKRYPEEFAYFKNSNDPVSNMIAEYDNSVLYNDMIIDSIFNMVKDKVAQDTSSIASALYVSDHGQNVYDENNTVGHTFAGKLPKSNVEIPLIAWFSQSYSEKFGLKKNTLISNRSLPFVADDLFHVILDLNFIATPYFDSKRSLFNENFDPKRKRILEDGKDYDLP